MASSPIIRLVPPALAAALLMAGCGRAVGAASGTALPPGVGRVTQVVDGDTIVVDFGRRSEKVRLLGIDTPMPNITT